MLKFNPRQKYIVNLIEGWGDGDERDRELFIPKDFKHLTVKAIANNPIYMRRVFEMTETEALKHIGDYDTRDPNWKLKALQDAGVLDGFLDDIVFSHFMNKRMLGK